MISFSILRLILFAILFTLSFGATQNLSGGMKEGVDAYNRQDYTVALKEFRALAEKGNVKAQNKLGKMYSKGEGVRRDYKEAAKWYRRAIFHGDADAQFALAKMYFKGQGVFKNFREAVVYLRKAAGQGHSESQNILGVMYIKGYGVLRDKVQAYMWFSLASISGKNKTAIKNKETIGEKMSPAQIKKALSFAKDWMERIKKNRGIEKTGR